MSNIFRAEYNQFLQPPPSSLSSLYFFFISDF